jgi:hypothetical protein
MARHGAITYTAHGATEKMVFLGVLGVGFSFAYFQ